MVLRLGKVELDGHVFFMAGGREYQFAVLDIYTAVPANVLGLLS
jgi:hypothetical protein